MMLMSLGQASDHRSRALRSYSAVALGSVSVGGGGSLTWVGTDPAERVK